MWWPSAQFWRISQFQCMGNPFPMVYDIKVRYIKRKCWPWVNVWQNVNAANVRSNETPTLPSNYCYQENFCQTPLYRICWLIPLQKLVLIVGSFVRWPRPDTNNCDPRWANALQLLQLSSPRSSQAEYDLLWHIFIRHFLFLSVEIEWHE